MPTPALINNIHRVVFNLLSLKIIVLLWFILRWDKLREMWFEFFESQQINSWYNLNITFSIRFYDREAKQNLAVKKAASELHSYVKPIPSKNNYISEKITE